MSPLTLKMCCRKQIQHLLWKSVRFFTKHFFYLKHELSVPFKKKNPKDTVNGDGIVNLSIKHGQYVKHRKIEGFDITSKV